MSEAKNDKKSLLVTGGSRGIGRAIVEKFAKEGYGVTFLYEKNDDAAREVESLTGATAVKCDISDASALAGAIKAAGKIDVLVNNAGISQIGLLSDFSDDDIERMIATDLTGTIIACREASAGMVARKYGRIINIGSMWGKVGASCESVYSAAKAGVRGFTMALAKELGPSGITVNCVEPGVIDTDMNRALGTDTLKSLGDDTPLCRLGTPADVAEAVFFLASDKAGFITGQILGVDGGFAI